MDPVTPSPELRDALGARPKMPRALAWTITGAIALASLMALLWPLLTRPSAPSPVIGAVGVIYKEIEVEGSAGRIGALAPDFAWVDPTGQLRTLASLRGRPIVINFWATWCVPCREEMPALERAAVAHPDIAFLAVDLQEDGDRVRAFFDSLGLKTLQPLLDPNGSVARRYVVFSLPTTFFVDRTGTIVHLEIGGPMKDEAIARGIAKASGPP